MPRPGTEKFLANPLEFARTHPLICVSNPVEVGSAHAHLHNKGAENGGGRVAVARHTLRTEQALCTATITKRQQREHANNLAYEVRAAQFTGVVEPDQFLAWYLPWNPVGGQVDMRIPGDPIVVGGVDVTPRFFFTIELTGCSVFVRGKHGSPEVFHSGSSGGGWEGTSIDHWRDLFEEHRPGSLGRGRAAEVHHSDYMGDMEIAPDGELGAESTARVRQYLRDLRRQEMFRAPWRKLHILMVMGIGTVFGIRQANGRWLFYLQESVRVVYTRGASESQRYANRALSVTQIWPKHGPPALLNDHIKELP